MTYNRGDSLLAMITARIEFNPGCGEHFCFDENQDVIEVKFEGLQELIETVQAFEPYISNCIVRIGKKVIDLKEVSRLNP